MILWIIEIMICIFIWGIKIKDKETFVIVACTILYLTLEFIGLKLSVFQRIALIYSVFLILLFAIFSRYFDKNSKIIYKLILLCILSASFISYAGSDTRIYLPFWV